MSGRMSRNKGKAGERENYEYFGIGVEVWSWFWGASEYWRFKIICRDGSVRHFAGVPNYCYSKRSALRRAWWRCKWLNDGTFSEHYKSPITEGQYQ